jgi:serine/threonine protein kinase
VGVRQGEQENGEVIAVKKLHMWPEGIIDDQLFINEIQHAMDICHPNIVRLKKYCYHTEAKLAVYNGGNIFVNEVYRLLCFEYMSNGSLDNYLSGMMILPSKSLSYQNMAVIIYFFR